MKAILRTSILVGCLLVAYNVSGCNQGDVIESIGNDGITTADFESYYEAEIEKISRMNNVKKKQLYEMICDPRMDGKKIFQPKNVYEKYRQSRIILSVANEENFLEDPRIQQIIENARNEAIAQLFVNQKFSEIVKISEDDKDKTCQDLRSREPARFGPLPIEDCKREAEKFLMAKLYRENAMKIQNDIKERVKIDLNKDFDKDEYLISGVALYNTIRKEGGCEAGTNTEEADAKTEETNSK